MNSKRIPLDRSKLLGFKLDPAAKAGAKYGAKFGNKVGGKPTATPTH